VGEFIIVSHEKEVNEWIYAASYPAWFLSESRFVERISPRYDLVAELAVLDEILPKGEKRITRDMFSI